MSFLFLLSGENPELAIFEISSLVKARPIAKSQKLLVLNARSISQAHRLAFTKRIIKLLFICPASKLEAKLAAFNWQRVYKRSFSLKLTALSATTYSERPLAAIIHATLKNPKVDLAKAATRIEIVIEGSTAYCGLACWENKEDFNSRKPQFRPGFMPTSMHPKLARAIVNLTGSRTKVLDPFCGTGGLLIEAGLMGLRVEGSDTDKRALELCKANLKHFGIKHKLRLRDACKLPKASYIATDMPYGRSSPVSSDNGIQNLYARFLKALKESGCKRAVVVSPANSHLERLAKGRTFDVYVHASLTRRILVIDK